MGATVANGHATGIGGAAGASVGAAGTGDDGENLAAVIHDVIKRGLDLVGHNI